MASISGGTGHGVRVSAGPVLAVLLALFAGPAVAQAHVNREVGPYTILVVLVEEPTFDDNHAGFEFWVRRASQPVVGLERTIQANATGHGTSIDLKMPPADGLGFYVLDRSTDGSPFDPLGGGPWSLQLTGSIDGTPLDETFAVTFPSYPRIGAPKPVAAQATPGASGGASTTLVIVLAGLLAVGAAIVGLRFRPGRAQPTPAP
jgi:hypothetical protein